MRFFFFKGRRDSGGLLGGRSLGSPKSAFKNLDFINHVFRVISIHVQFSMNLHAMCLYKRKHNSTFKDLLVSMFFA